MGQNDRHLTYNEVFDKLLRFCAYQERCEWDVHRKLKKLAFEDKNGIKKLLQELKDLDVLNEKRFVETFVRGKFRLKKWGPQRIKYELRSRKVNDELIQFGLSLIESEEFHEQFRSIAEKKWNSIKAKSTFEKKSKFLRYFYNKGYDTDTINSYLREIKDSI